jgi:hypothetical protein
MDTEFTQYTIPIRFAETFRLFNSWEDSFMQGQWDSREDAIAFQERNHVTGGEWHIVRVKEIRNPQWHDDDDSHDWDGFNE